MKRCRVNEAIYIQNGERTWNKFIQTFIEMIYVLHNESSQIIMQLGWNEGETRLDKSEGKLLPMKKSDACRKVYCQYSTDNPNNFITKPKRVLCWRSENRWGEMCKMHHHRSSLILHGNNTSWNEKKPKFNNKMTNFILFSIKCK